MTCCTVFCKKNTCKQSKSESRNDNNNKLCGRPLQYARLARDLDLWPFDLESGIRVTGDVGYLCANFSLPRPLYSRLRPDVRDRRQTDIVRRASSINVPSAGHNNATYIPDTVFWNLCNLIISYRLQSVPSLWSSVCELQQAHINFS